MFYLNVHGQLSRGIQELVQAAAGRDVLVFTETWLGEGQRTPDIAGYRAFHYSRPDALQAGQARGGHGVLRPDGAPQLRPTRHV